MGGEENGGRGVADTGGIVMSDITRTIGQKMQQGVHDVKGWSWGPLGVFRAELEGGSVSRGLTLALFHYVLVITLGRRDKHGG